MTRRSIALSVVAAVAFIVAVVVACVALWPQLTDAVTATAATASAQIVAAAGGVLSGIAGAVAAVAAYAAARESRRTARDATEALGLAMEPTLELRPFVTYVDPSGARTVAIITNKSRWGASNVLLEVELSDGRKVTHRTENLPRTPDYDPRVGGKESQVVVPLGEPRPQPWDSMEWRGSAATEERFVLSYSDERGLIRWCRRHTIHRTYSATDQIRSESEGTAVTTERII